MKKFKRTKFARIMVFCKFIVWDILVKRINITFKECWVVAGINTIMLGVPPRMG